MGKYKRLDWTMKMNVNELEKTDLIIYRAITGSHAYGTQNPQSDLDLRGIFILPLKNRLSLFNTIEDEEVSQDSPTDLKYYELEKFFQLAKDFNPNIAELMYLPTDCIQVCTSKMKHILDNRHLFVSKKAFDTHCGYAFAQIKKMKGVNKWISNPKPQEHPSREEFCHVVDTNDMWNLAIQFKGQLGFPTKINSTERFPFRPIPLRESGIDLAHIHVSSLEHVPNVYRMYYYGKGAKGVFRKGNLACESIPKEDEIKRFRGLLIYNVSEYNRAMLDWKNYHAWIKERNPHRWISQERGEIDYDCKNAQHCIRLLRSCRGVFVDGAPIVRFTGQDLQHLKDIRSGKFTYDEILKESEDLVRELRLLYEKSKLPDKANEKAIDSLFKELVL